MSLSLSKMEETEMSKPFFGGWGGGLDGWEVVLGFGDGL